ncbi:beta strand repeat-containing protein, partial [Acidiphilium sp.]|uniref:beta strand repeat-containing protein n=1 Tax=Acidiphilium sp. TaxID=527 RepID=UPI003D006A0A
MSKSDLLAVDGTVTNNGSVQLTGGNATGATAQMTVAGAMTTTGSVSIGTNSQLTIGNGNAYTQTAGTTTVDGTLTGAVLNQGGTVQGSGTIDGTVTNAAAIGGGNYTNDQTGSLSISGGYTNQSTGTVNALLQGTGAGQASSLAVTAGPVLLAGGTLTPITSNGFTLAAGQSFTPLTFGTDNLTGEFGALSYNGATGNGTSVDLGNGLTLEASYNNGAGNVTLQVVNTPTNTADSWNGGTGTFSTASGWSNAVPVPTSDVTIGSTGNGAVTLDQDATVNSLAINGGNALTYQAATPQSLTAGAGVTVAAGGSLSMPTTGDKLAVGGTLSNAGTTDVGAGSVYDLGTTANQTGGTMTLAGGSVTAAAITNASGATLGGNGTLTTTGGGPVANAGTITASGGTLVATPGIAGAGTASIATGATLDLSHASGGSTTGTLADSGGLALGANSITVSSDYDNTNTGVGNAYDNHAGVTGTGAILAAGNVALAVSGSGVANGGTATPTLALGNVHVGSTNTAQYAIENTGTTGPALRGAIQNTGITDPSLGVTAQNFGPIATGGSTTESLTYDPTTAGALAGQSVKIVSNFDNVAGQTMSITGAAYAYATPTVTSSLGANNASLNFGVVQVGQAVTDHLTVANTLTAPSAAYQEGLDASFGTTTNPQLTTSGSITNLAAGQSSNAMAVTLDATQAGSVGGTVGLDFVSNGTIDGLGNTALPSQSLGYTWSLGATVINQANPNITPASIDFGNVRIGSTPAAQALSVQNVATGSPQASLDAQLSTSGAAVSTNLSSIH